MKDSQIILDLEDANLRLANLRRAIQRRDEAAAEVVLRRTLYQRARRKLKEAEWDLTVHLGEERRRAPMEGAKDGAAKK